MKRIIIAYDGEDFVVTLPDGKRLFFTVEAELKEWLSKRKLKEMLL